MIIIGEKINGARNLDGFTAGILVQTVGEMEDSYDFEAMAERVHKEHFREMYAALRKREAPVLPLGTGCCGRCAAFTRLFS